MYQTVNDHLINLNTILLVKIVDSLSVSVILSENYKRQLVLNFLLSYMIQRILHVQ